MIETIAGVGMIIESVIEAVTLIKNRKKAKDGADVKHYVAAASGSFLSWAFGIDVIKMMGLKYAVTVPEAVTVALPIVLFGVLSFRYAGAFNDILSWVNHKRFG